MMSGPHADRWLWRVALAGQDHDPVAPHSADHTATRAGGRHGLRDQQLRSAGTQRSSRERAEHQAQPALCAQHVSNLPTGHRWLVIRVWHGSLHHIGTYRS